MSEYDDWLFKRDENEEFQRELPEILKDGFANQRRGRRREPDYLYLYVNDFTPKELLAKTQADRQKRIAWFERERQQEQDRIAGLSPTEKLLEAVNRGAILLPSEVAEEIKAIFTPATLATMVGVFAAYIAAHATGIGQAMDIGMLIAGGIFFGLDAFAIFKDIAGFAGAVNATTEEELDQAGEHLASAVAKIGVDAVMTLLTRKVADKIQAETQISKVGNQGRNTEPLTEAQRAEVNNYAEELGIPEDTLMFTDNGDTGYAMFFGVEKVQVGPDIVPHSQPQQSGITANSRISIRGSLAHEWVGHGGARRAERNFKTGEAGSLETDYYMNALEEAQASIRAARFAPGLTMQERYVLLRDGIARLRKQGIKIKDVRHLLYIEE